MGKRRDRLDQRQADQKASKSRNGPRKVKERERRTARMKAILKEGKLPYTRPVRTWLAAQLGKKESQITQADVDQLAK